MIIDGAPQILAKVKARDALLQDLPLLPDTAEKTDVDVAYVRIVLPSEFPTTHGEGPESAQFSAIAGLLISVQVTPMSVLRRE